MPNLCLFPPARLVNRRIALLVLGCIGALAQAQDESPLNPVRLQVPPYVAITATPYIAKDPDTGAFTIYVKTKQTVYGSSGVLTLTLDETGLHREMTVPVAGGTTDTPTWHMDLAGLGVPRFTRPMHFTVSATVTRAGVSSRPATVTMPEVKLPMVVVRGINPISSDPWEDATFVGGMIAYGYVEQPAAGLYTTLFYLHNDPYGTGLNYDPTYELLDRNALCLNNYVEYVVRPNDPVTYADKVDIVAHSKGGLVSREYLYLYPTGASRVRRLVMCASPHLGSAEAWIDNIINVGAIKQLYPTYNWYRSSSSQSWSQKTPNTALLDLNANSRMPASVDYYLLYGSTGSTSTSMSYTGLYPFGSTGKADGDDYVLGWSALGYDVQIAANGTPTQGNRIPAFDPAYGARAPTTEMFMPGMAHTGFLGNAVETIYSVLTQ